MPHTIMLVDDDADTRALLGAFLTEQGFRVLTAQDGQQALDMLARIPSPDLIMLDYKMPVMTGQQFLAYRRRFSRLRDIPVVVLSAWTREWTGVRLDVNAVLTKPLDLERMLCVVTSICADQHHWRSPTRRAETGGARAP